MLENSHLSCLKEIKDAFYKTFKMSVKGTMLTIVTYFSFYLLCSSFFCTMLVSTVMFLQYTLLPLFPSVLY